MVYLSNGGELQRVARNDDTFVNVNYYSRVAVPLERGSTYYIVVCDACEQGDYHPIRMSATAFDGGPPGGSPASPDACEEDDDPATAVILGLDTNQDHSLSPIGDMDWFVYTVP